MNLEIFEIRVEVCYQLACSGWKRWLLRRREVSRVSSHMHAYHVTRP